MDLTTHNENKIHGTKTIFKRFEDYLSEFVYGGIDGCVTTFAVVAGSVGASLDSSVILILGFANLLADGLSMSIGAYLSTKSEKDNFQKHKEIEYWEVDNLPDKEREEVVEIYEAKGFKGELLEQIVDHITSDRDRWVDIMMKEELEMIEEQKSPIMIGASTYISFIIVGLIPLIVYVWDYFVNPIQVNTFLLTCIFTGIGFIFVGLMKAVINNTSKIKGMLETLTLGTAAAVVSYYVGFIIEMYLL